MMNNRHGGDFDAIDQLEYEHANEHLCTHDQYIAHGDFGSIHERSVKTRISKSDVEEWIHADDEDDDLGRSCYVVVDESATVDFIEVCVFFAVYFLEEEEL